LIDWAPIEHQLRDISCAAKGEPAWPPLALFKAMLIAVWHDLSDVRLAEALDDRASFRCFCGFSAHEPTPERTAFVRLRAQLAARGLDQALFEVVTDQLRAKAITVKTGTLVDATVIASASHADPEAGWAGHQRRMGSTASTPMSAPMLIPPSLRRSASRRGMCMTAELVVVPCLRHPARSMPIAPTVVRSSTRRSLPAVVRPASC
jgi:IS5 family transposase